MTGGKFDYYKCGQCGQIHSVPKPPGMEGSEGVPLISICRKCCSENMQKAESIPCLIIQKGRNVQDMPKGDYMCFGFSIRLRRENGEPLHVKEVMKILAQGTVKFYEGEMLLKEAPLSRIPSLPPLPPVIDTTANIPEIYNIEPHGFPRKIDLTKIHAVIEWPEGLVCDKGILCDFVVHGDMIVEERESE